MWKDLGNLLLGALMFWAYVAYSQFLIVWSGNLPREAAWYLHRNAGGWHGCSSRWRSCNCSCPCCCCSRNSPSAARAFFAALAGGVVLGQAVYVYWLVLPTFRPAGIGFHPLDALLPLAMDAWWLWVFLGHLPVARKEESADA